MMKSTVLLAVLSSLFFNSVSGNSCGGLLEGEQGHFSLANTSNQDQPHAPSSSCLWIIQLHYEENIRFTLDALDDDALLNVYPEDQLTSCSLNNYTKLNSTHVQSSFEFLGKTFIVVLPNSTASVAFSWHFIGNEDKNTSVTTMKNSDYISSPNGVLEWVQLETVERVTWGINTYANFDIKWNVDATTPTASCDAIDNCACFYFAIFHLTSEGKLSQALRACGQSSEGKLEGISGRVVVLVKVNSKVEDNKVAVNWGFDDVAVTESPVTEPPVTIPTGIFAATTTGLIALNLHTLEATSLTSEEAVAVAVNRNLQKVYWSEVGGNCSILRSNFNGSDIETIVPPTGEYIQALAVHEPSGNFYFSVRYSNQITVCNSIGGNCAVVLSSSLASNAWSITFDSKNNEMYWSNHEPSHTSLIRANLNGSNVEIFSSEFSGAAALTLVQPSDNTIYWADSNRSTIGTINVNGSNKRTLLQLVGNPSPAGIQVDASKIYFGNWSGKTIQSVNRDSGEELSTIFNSTGKIRHLALFSVSV